MNHDKGDPGERITFWLDFMQSWMSSTGDISFPFKDIFFQSKDISLPFKDIFLRQKIVSHKLICYVKIYVRYIFGDKCTYFPNYWREICVQRYIFARNSQNGDTMGMYPGYNGDIMGIYISKCGDINPHYMDSENIFWRYILHCARYIPVLEIYISKMEIYPGYISKIEIYL